MKPVTHLRLVLASPGDVQPERDEMQGIVDEVNQTLRILKYAFHLELWRWETDSHPGLHALGPQGLIDDALQIENCDLPVGIFWQRLGTRVRDAGSGTEHEIRKAITAWQEKGSPQVMLYFNTAPSTPTDAVGIEQVSRLAQFRRELLVTVNPLTSESISMRDFRDKARGHLLMKVAEIAQRASAGSHSPLRFEFMVRPVRVRAEGNTELLGDMFLRCICAVELQVPGPLWFGVVLFLNTSVTSRIAVAPGGDALSEALVQEVGRPGVTDVYPGVVTGNSIAFGQIDLTGMQPREVRTFRITNVRCNATPIDRIFAAISVGGLQVDNDTAQVAVAKPSLRFEVRESNNTQQIKSEVPQDQPSRLTTLASLLFAEEFSEAFKIRNTTAPNLFRAESDGLVCLSESNPLGPLVRLTGSSQFCGIADYGTRFRATIECLPPGARLFAGERNTNAQNSSMEAALVQTTSSASPAEGLVTIGGDVLREVLVKNGSSCVTWELISRNPTTSRRQSSIEFLVAIIVDEHSDGLRMPIGCLVHGSYAPGPPDFSVSAASVASSSLPIPRFRSSMVPGSFLVIRW